MKWLRLWSDCVVTGPFSIGTERTFQPRGTTSARCDCLPYEFAAQDTRQLAGAITDRARVDRGEPDDEAVEPTASPRMIGKRSHFDIGFRRRGGRRTVINFRRERSRD